MIQARTVLWIMAFIGFAINYMVAINLSIAIVEMIEPTPTTSAHESLSLDPIYSANLSGLTTENIQTSLLNSVPDFNTLNEYPNNSTLDSMEYATNATSSKPEYFRWDENQQAVALGAFFWTHWMTQIFGGVLGKKYGTKIVFGLSNVISCWICFLLPMAAKTGLYALVVLRLFQGLLTGLTLPAMHEMTARWIPPNERSKFVTSYFGSSIGVAVFYPLYAYIMYFSSWEWTFHVSGVLGTIWWFAWLYLVYNTPAEHPRISYEELTYIEKSLGNMKTNSNKTKTPWIAILTSNSVWMNIIGQFALLWGLFTLMTQTPIYFKMLHNWDIRATGVFSGLPHLLRVLFAFVFSLYADYLLNNNKMSRTNVRKFATGLACFANGIFVLALAYLGTNRILAVTLITLAVMFQGCGSSGPLSSMIDISPNYAGIICGICGTIACIPGFVSTYIIGILTLNNQTFDAWANVFLICAGVLIGCGSLYICFADSTLQSWNDNTTKIDEGNKNQLLEKDVGKC